MSREKKKIEDYADLFFAEKYLKRNSKFKRDDTKELIDEINGFIQKMDDKKYQKLMVSVRQNRCRDKERKAQLSIEKTVRYRLNDFANKHNLTASQAIQELLIIAEKYGITKINFV